MDAKKKAEWERWRRLGKWRYVLLVTLLYVVVNLVVFPFVRLALSDEALDMGIVVVALFTGLTVGPVMGLVGWNSNERAYQDSTSHEASRTD